MNLEKLETDFDFIDFFYQQNIISRTDDDSVSQNIGVNVNMQFVDRTNDSSSEGSDQDILVRKSRKRKRRGGVDRVEWTENSIT